MALNLTLMTKAIVNQLDVIEDAVFICQDDKVVYGNSCFYDCIGYSKELVNSMKISDVLAPETIKTFKILNKRGGKTNNLPKLGQIEYIEADGSICSIIFYATSTTFHGKEAAQVTIRKLMNQTNTSISKDYSTPQCMQLLESSLAGVLILCGAEPKLMYANPVIRRIFALIVKKYEKIDILDYIHTDYREILRSRYSRRLADESVPANYRFKALNINGEPIWFEGNFQRIQYQGEHAVLCNLRDVTATVNHYSLINAQPEQLATIFNGLDIGISIIDIETFEIIFINDYFINILGPVNHKRCYEYFGKDKPQCGNCICFKPTHSAGSPTLYAEHKFAANGRWYQFLKKTMIWPDGRTVLMDVAIDITEQKLASQAKSDFLARMSHEIRTPIAGIIGFADLLSRDNLDERQSESVNIIQDCSQQLLRLVNDILDISKIEAGKISLDSIDFVLNSLLVESIGVVSSAAAGKDVSINLVVDSDVPQTFRGDSNRIRQILNNLLSNAVKFTSNGQITVRACQSDYFTEDDVFPLQISVTDTGIGMTKKEQNHIFDPFTQADSSTTRKYGGTGLGLTISKHLVELMGGSIFVESRKRKGTSVSFWLPLSPGSDISSINDLQYCSKFDSFPSASILIVEDIAVNQKLLTYMIEKIGCTSFVVNNGYECLLLLEQSHFDLVLMDMQMPIMNGYDTTRYIRENSEWENLPIVALTAHAMEGDKEKCMAAGCNYFLTKPFTVDQLTKAITYCLDLEAASPDDANDLLDSAIMEELRNEFFVSLTEMVENLKVALNKNDFEAMRSISHDIKGTAGLYG
ncbi:MAG: ATP-binding protein, partial [Ignavibacteriales bacterium]